MQILLNHTGTGTLGQVHGEEEGSVTEYFDVPVIPGDEILLKNNQPIALIKIDVEGFELSALRGLQQTLQRWHPLVTTELIEWHLQRSGSTPKDVIDLMTQAGYRGYKMESSGPRGKRPVLRLRNLDPVAKGLKDILWVHNQSTAWACVANSVQG
jgi:hypothetical protein